MNRSTTVRYTYENALLNRLRYTVNCTLSTTTTHITHKPSAANTSAHSAGNNFGVKILTAPYKASTPVKSTYSVYININHLLVFSAHTPLRHKI